MKNEHTCTYLRRDEALVAYLYDEGNDAGGRAAFESHIKYCGVCRDELEALQGVRGRLVAWAPPELLEHVSQRATPRRSTSSAPTRTVLSGVTWWAQAAAAVLCVGIGVGAANLRISSGPEGLTVRTGWLASGPTQSGSSERVAQGPGADQAAWRSELAALEGQLRSEIQQVASARPSMPRAPEGESALRQVRALIGESERRQQRELALRVGDLVRDVQTQRVADLSKIDRSLGMIQSSTGMEVLRQRQILNSLVRVSQQQP